MAEGEGYEWPYEAEGLQRPPDLTNWLGQANYSLNPEIRYNRIFYEVNFFSFEKLFVKPGNSLKTDSLNPEASVLLFIGSIGYLENTYFWAYYLLDFMQYS